MPNVMSDNKVRQ